MTTTPADTTWLDDILTDVFYGEISWIHDQLDGTSFIKDSLDAVENNKYEAKATILDHLQEHERLARIDEAQQAYLTSADEPDADKISRDLKDRLIALRAAPDTKQGQDK